MERECVTHHICDCLREKMDALEAALERAESALRSIACVPWTGERAAQWWDTERMPAIKALNQLATRAGADAGEGEL